MIDEIDRLTLEEGIEHILAGRNLLDTSVGLAAEAVQLTYHGKSSNLVLDHLWRLADLCAQLAIAENVGDSSANQPFNVRRRNP